MPPFRLRPLENCFSYVALGLTVKRVRIAASSFRLRCDTALRALACGVIEETIMISTITPRRPNTRGVVMHRV